MTELRYYEFQQIKWQKNILLVFYSNDFYVLSANKRLFQVRLLGYPLGYLSQLN